MLRFILWAFLSSASLPFTLQSPVQAEEVRQPQQTQGGGGWGNPINALTSAFNPSSWQKREEEHEAFQPVPALSSFITRRENGPGGPLSGATSQYPHTYARNIPRSQIDTPMTTATTLVTATRVPAKAFPTPTIDSNLPLQTPNDSPIPTKTGLANCNVQGTPSADLTDNILERISADDPLSCQLLCMYQSRCESYSFEESSSASAKNCVFYSTYIDGTTKVTSSSSGVFFSDKYPDDGSNFCYGSNEL